MTDTTIVIAAITIAELRDNHTAWPVMHAHGFAHACITKLWVHITRELGAEWGWTAMYQYVSNTKFTIIRHWVYKVLVSFY